MATGSIINEASKTYETWHQNYEFKTDLSRSRIPLLIKFLFCHIFSGRQQTDYFPTLVSRVLRP